MGSNTGTTMTLANSIIGVSVLAMPFCFKQCGIILSIIMLLLSSVLSRLACHFLLKAAIMSRRRNFEFLAFHVFGSTGKLTAELCIIGFLMGTCIAFFVVVGDLGPEIVGSVFGIESTPALRQTVLIGLAAFVILPLGLLRNIDSLSVISIATIGFYVSLVFKVVFDAMPHLAAGDWAANVHFWRPAGILKCIPIFSMSLSCQTQLFEIYGTLHNASLDKMNNVIKIAVNMCTGVYICVGFFGYIAFYSQNFTGNLLLSFAPTMISEVFKLGFVLSVAVSFPFVIFPCRASLYSLLFRRNVMPYHENIITHIPELRFKWLTLMLIITSLAVGLLIPSIELVLGLVGSTIGVVICVMFPAAAFICVSSKSSSERFLAQVVLFVGALILILGSYATLNGSIEYEDALPKQILKQQDSINFGVTLNEEKSVKVKVKPVDNLPYDQGMAAVTGSENIIVNKQEISKNEKIKVYNKSVSSQKTPVIQPFVETPIISKDDHIAHIPENNLKREQEVNADAIRKEDAELAEAEKLDMKESEKKNAELLETLAKHKEQQMEMLQEQRAILQKLTEHKNVLDQEKQKKVIDNDLIKIEKGAAKIGKDKPKNKSSDIIITEMKKNVVPEANNSYIHSDNILDLAKKETIKLKKVLKKLDEARKDNSKTKLEVDTKRRHTDDVQKTNVENKPSVIKNAVSLKDIQDNDIAVKKLKVDLTNKRSTLLLKRLSTFNGTTNITNEKKVSVPQNEVLQVVDHKRFDIELKREKREAVTVQNSSINSEKHFDTSNKTCYIEKINEVPPIYTKSNLSSVKETPFIP